MVVNTSSSNVIQAQTPTKVIESGCKLNYNVSISVNSSTRDHYIQVKPHDGSSWATIASASSGSSFVGTVDLNSYVGKSIDIRFGGSNSSSNSTTSYTINNISVTK